MGKKERGERKGEREREMKPPAVKIFGYATVY